MAIIMGIHGGEHSSFAIVNDDARLQKLAYLGGNN